MKKILYITSANLATNPRLVKEIDSLSLLYNIDVVLFDFIHWSSELDVKMRDERKHINFFLFDVSKKSLINWAKWAILEKACRILFPFFKKNLKIVSGALSRKSLILSPNRIENRGYDIIIGHNISTLFPVFNISQKWNIPFGYDIEDFDPGMLFPNAGNDYKEVCEILYKKILSQASYITSASDLIGEYSLKLIGNHKNHKTIINSFPGREFVDIGIELKKQTAQTEALKIVWFSMTISRNRGLEEFFEAVSELTFPMEITLIGSMQEEFRDTVILPLQQRVPNLQLSIIDPLPQAILHQQLVNFDIGLALEISTGDLNKNICLSNKIVAYAQAGIYILASNTLGQNKFISDHKTNGTICELNKESILNSLVAIYNMRESIRENRIARFESNVQLAWENQVPIIDNLISKALSNTNLN